MSDWKNRQRKKANGAKAKPPPITLTPETRKIVVAQYLAFREKFGRDASVADPLFFDPDTDDVRPLTGDRLRAAMVAAAVYAGIPEAEAAAALSNVSKPNQG